MSKNDFVRARTDSDLKQRVEVIFAQLGLNITDAINIFLAQVDLHQGFPFEIKIPNSTTIAAIKEAEHPEKLKSYQNFSELRSDARKK